MTAASTIILLGCAKLPFTVTHTISMGEVPNRQYPIRVVTAIRLTARARDLDILLVRMEELHEINNLHEIMTALIDNRFSI